MKLFANRAINRKSLRKEICLMAKESGVRKVAFSNKGKHVTGTFNAVNDVIFIDMKQTRKEMLLTFFHELGHFTAVKKRKWLMYHYNPSTPLISATEKFNIENKIDKIAKQLWNKHVDITVWGKYRYGYPQVQKREIVNWFHTY